MAERLLVRTQGGPNPGTRVAEGWAWPLPELLLTEGGSYVKVSESRLPPMGEGSQLLRGAEYRWQEGDATAEQLDSAIAVAVKTRRLKEATALLHLLAVKDPEGAALIHDAVHALAPGTVREHRGGD